MRTAIKTIVYIFVFFATAFIVMLFNLFKEGREPVILMYHSVGAQGERHSSLNVPEEVFARQMDFLYRHGYKVIPLTELAEKIKAGQRVGRKTLAITFDDGYSNNYSKVFPVLKKYGFPATIFVITAKIGKEYHVAPGIKEKLLNKEEISEMERSGLIDFGSHTLNHSYLPGEKDLQVLLKEISSSKVSLERITGREVLAFCYPLGGYNKTIRDMVERSGYQVAVTTNKRNNGKGTDIYALPRVKVTSSRSIFRFFVGLSGYYLRLKDI